MPPLGRTYLLVLIGLLLHAPAIRAQEEVPRPAEAGSEEAPADPGDEEARAETEDEEAPSFLSNIHGDLLTRYVLRTRESETDQDFYQTLRVWGRDSEDGRFRFLLHGLLTWDIDGRAGSEVFADRGNLFDSSAHGYLYSAYVEAHDLPRGWVERIRAGRQFVYAPETFHFDGATMKTASWGGISARGLVGVPVHLYESSPRGDFLAGGGLSYEPWDWARLGADYVHVEDKRIEPDRTEDRETDDLFSIHALARVSTHTRAGGAVSWINDQFRRVDGRVHSHWVKGGLSGGIRLTYQPETLREFSFDLSPFFHVLTESRPYYQVLANVEKHVTEDLSLEVGGSVRQLLDDDDEGNFNREFTRAFAAVHATDIPVEKVSVSLIGEAWFTEIDDVYSLGGDVSWRPAARWKASTGYYFSLFKIDRVTLDEREDVQTYFVKVKGPVVGPVTFDVAYEMELGEGPTFHIVETGVRVSF